MFFSVLPNNVIFCHSNMLIYNIYNTQKKYSELYYHLERIKDKKLFFKKLYFDIYVHFLKFKLKENKLVKHAK